MEVKPATAPWKSEKFEVKQKLLTIGQSYEILVEESGRIVGICTNSTVGTLKRLVITFDDSEMTPLFEIVRAGSPSAVDGESCDPFMVRDVRSGERLGGLKLFNGSRSRGEMEILGSSGKSMVNIFKKGTLGSILKIIPALGRKIHYHIREGEQRKGGLIRMHGRLGDVWSVDLGPNAGDEGYSRLVIAAVLILDILR